jgi:aspartyl-tRNA(Asn)/glutamyl-tRNA(Gln) amidotransferase subunit A
MSGLNPLAGDAAAGSLWALDAIELSRLYRTGTVSPTEALAAVLARLEEVNPALNAVIAADEVGAKAAALLSAERWLKGEALSPLDGVPITIKDNILVEGLPATWGSRLYAGFIPDADEPAVARLRAAGAVIVGKTNMSEFAFTGVGMNPHYGTPGNPADRSRVPGGSSSGAAVAVADAMCEIAIGTDTGGSTRIPAALCGVVGFKPTRARVPTEGAYPLSPTLDSIGPIARTVADCALADAVLAGEEPWALQAKPLYGSGLGLLQGEPLSELDETVAATFETAIAKLERAGATLSDANIPALEHMARVNSVATIAAAEAFQIHKERLDTRGAEYDQFIRRRIEGGSAVTREGHRRMIEERNRLAAAMDQRMSPFDALVLPTTPIVAPLKSELADAGAFSKANRLLLRNTAIANFYDLCAISLPLPGGGLPAGLMLFGRHGDDRALLSIGAAVERLFRG